MWKNIGAAWSRGTGKSKTKEGTSMAEVDPTAMEDAAEEVVPTSAWQWHREGMLDLAWGQLCLYEQVC